MSLLRRLACAILGHREGHGLFRYVYRAAGRAALQWPGRTYTIVRVGFECARCRRRLEE